MCHVLVTVMALGKPELVRYLRRVSLGEAADPDGLGGMNTVIVRGRTKVDVDAYVESNVWSCDNESSMLNMNLGCT